MKNLTPINYVLAALVLVLMASSCKKDAQTTKSSTSTTATTAILSSSQAILAGTVTTSSDTTTKDSVYLIGCYPGGGKADSVAFSSLPSAIGTYLTANYSGYTFKKAFEALTKAGANDGYVVLIQYNGAPVGLKFDASGTFVKVLEQVDRHDLPGGQGGPGPGFHPGGPFGYRNGKHQDTIAISALPATITAYFTANYPADTLDHAVINPDSSYVVFSHDSGIFATAFSAKLAFVSRQQLMTPPAPPTPVTAANLPAAITTYLTTTYPGYVFDKAFSFGKNGTIKNYVVLIEANSTRYAVEFDASGSFVKSVAIK